jgi:GTP-binding protein HflX
VLAEDKLFATLDTRSRHLKVGWAGYGDREVVITDTVGFIRSLPKDLFAAFRSTFEEAADADLLLIVVDANDPARDEHMQTTDEVLAELQLDAIPRIVVFNKADLLAPFARKLLQKRFRDAVVLAATDRETMRPLLGRIAQRLAGRWDDSAKTPPSLRDLSLLDDAPDDGDDAADDLTATQDAARAASAEEARAGTADEGATLDDLLRISGRRVKQAGAPTVGQAPDPGKAQ